VAQTVRLMAVGYIVASIIPMATVTGKCSLVWPRKVTEVHEFLACVAVIC